MTVCGIIGGNRGYAFDQVLQFADVAGKTVVQQQFEGRARQHNLAIVTAADPCGEVLRQHQHVLRTRAQRRHFEYDGGDPEIEVLAEQGPSQFRERPVGGGDHPHVHVLGAGASYRAQFLILQHPQQLHLNVLGHLADFVEEDGAARKPR